MANSTSYLRHDISKLAQNCRLKEVASRFQANKSTSFDADNKAEFDQLVSQGKDQSVYLWMLHLPNSTDRELLHALADVYRLVADLLDVLSLLLGSSKRGSLLPRTLAALAESQCLLRSLALDLGVTHELTQSGIHRIVTVKAAQDAVYVSVGLRDEDRIEAASLPRLRNEQERLAKLITSVSGKSRSNPRSKHNRSTQAKAHPKTGLSLLLIGQDDATLTDRIKTELGVEVKVTSPKKSDSYRRFVDRATSDKFTHVIVAGFDSITDLGKLAQICKASDKRFRAIGGKLTMSKLLRALEEKN